MSDYIGGLIQSAKTKDFQSLARLLTALEREGPRLLSKYPELLSPPSAAFRLGLTGPPGAGKSTLMSQIIRELRVKGLRVAVMAVDPSSPFTKGAVLGDRIRYSEHFLDEGVFIRSLGTRGSLGGLSSAAYLMVRAFDLAGFDLVLIETVGVGQTELEIMNVADWVSVVLVPESGDSIQAMKAGLLEIADSFIVNKSDRPGADSFVRELEAAMKLSPQATHKAIFSTVATTGQGLSEYVAGLLSVRAKADWKAKRQELSRLKSEAQALLRLQAEVEIQARTNLIQSAGDFAGLFASGERNKTK